MKQALSLLLTVLIQQIIYHVVNNDPAPTPTDSETSGCMSGIGNQ